MIDAAVSNGSLGDTAESDYTTVAFVDGVGKGATITPAKGDTGKKLFVPNAGYRDAAGARSNYGTFGFFFSATQRDAANAWYLVFRSAYPSGIISSGGANKLRPQSLRCVRS